METVTLDFVQEKKLAFLLLKFPFNRQFNEVVKKLPTSSWSNSRMAWRINYSRENLLELKKQFHGIANIEEKVFQEKLSTYKNSSHEIKRIELTEDQKNNIEKFKNYLRSRRYSESTVGTYCDALKSFLKFHQAKKIEEITNEDVILFNNEFVLKFKLSASYQNQVVNSIKLFFREIQNKNIDVNLIQRPRREHKLPNVLSKEEIQSILSAPKNVKHKAMLALIYSCGLRRSELLNLRITDIDSNRKLIIIRNAKGNKDRIAPLSEKIILMLRDYYKMYRPEKWLFEGQNKGENYSEKSLESVLKQALGKTKIKKPVSLHWLRHSYATHLLENGTDLRFIQEILGHKSSKTTEIYTHVSTKSLQNIKSPFDDLVV